MFAQKSAHFAPAAKLDASLLVRRRAPHAATPATSAAPETIAVSVRLTPALQLRLRLLAALTHRSRREIVRAAIERTLTLRGTRAPATPDRPHEGT